MAIVSGLATKGVGLNSTRVLIIFLRKGIRNLKCTGCLKSKYTLSTLICFSGTHPRVFTSSENIVWISSKI